MTTVVFLGPTLARDEARSLLDADYRPPAAQGDVYRAGLAGAETIGVVDGLFRVVPSIWHKEIIWCLAQGIRVYGSASMGALRAAELAPYGMVGVGEIFALYARGALEDDDEVAITHGPAEVGFRSASDAMVDIRATLAAAFDAGCIAEATRLRLERMAKSLFYPNRSYRRLLDDARAEGVPADELARLEGWLPTGRVEAKAADAREMLRAIAAGRREAIPARPEVRVEETIFWRDFQARFGP